MPLARRRPQAVRLCVTAPSRWTVTQLADRKSRRVPAVRVRRLIVLARLAGFVDNQKRIERIYRSAALQVRKRVRRKLALARGPINERPMAPKSAVGRWASFTIGSGAAGNTVSSSSVTIAPARTWRSRLTLALSGVRMTHTLDAIAT